MSANLTAPAIDGVANIIVKTIEHSEQRYETCGDWTYSPQNGGTITLYVSRLPDWRMSMAIAVHEIFEALLCVQREVPQKSVDNFDIAFESVRKPGNENEPGDDPSAPYYDEHQVGTLVEHLAAKELGFRWDDYADTIEGLEYNPITWVQGSDPAIAGGLGMAQPSWAPARKKGESEASYKKRYYTAQRVNATAAYEKDPSDTGAQKTLQSISKKLSKSQRSAFLPNDLTSGAAMRKPGATEGDQMLGVAAALEGGPLIGALRGAGKAALGAGVRAVAGRGAKALGADAARGLARTAAPATSRVVGKATVQDVPRLALSAGKATSKVARGAGKAAKGATNAVKSAARGVAKRVASATPKSVAKAAARAATPRIAKSAQIAGKVAKKVVRGAVKKKAAS